MSDRSPQLSDFPYEPALRGQEMHYDGFEKLRCIEDEKLRELVFAGMLNGWQRQREAANRPPPKPRNDPKAVPDRTCMDPEPYEDDSDRRHP